MFAGLGKDPRHPDLLCDHSGAHLRASCSLCPLRMRTKIQNLELDLDVDAGGQIELHESIDGLRGRIDNVEKTLVGAHLELLAALLVDVRRTVDGELLDAGWQRNGSANLCTGALRRVHDLPGRRIENPMVERLETDANILAVHCRAFFSEWRVASSEWISLFATHHSLFASYSMIEATTPAPTVRPPSRIAKRSFSSIAIGTIRCTSIAMLSPGITISVPSGRCTTPVTSVVRK